MQVRENRSSKFLGADAAAASAAAALRQCPMTKAKGPSAGGVKKKQVDGDYKKRRKPVPSNALASKDKAAATTDLVETAAVTNDTKPKSEPVKKHDGRPTTPSCKHGLRMVWMSKNCVQLRGGGFGKTAMMRHEQGRQNGHWVMIKSHSRYI
jgi:hypothetical protein